MDTFTAISMLVGTCLIPDHPHMFQNPGTKEIACCSSPAWDPRSCYAGEPCAVGAPTFDGYYCCGIKEGNAYVTCSEEEGGASLCDSPNHEYCDNLDSTASCPIPNFQNRYVFTVFVFAVGRDNDDEDLGNPPPSSTYTACFSDSREAYTSESNDACAVATNNRRCAVYTPPTILQIPYGVLMRRKSNVCKPTVEMPTLRTPTATRTRRKMAVPPLARQRSPRASSETTE